jgi:porin
MRCSAQPGVPDPIWRCGQWAAVLAAGALLGGPAAGADIGARWVGDFAAVVEGGLHEGERQLGLVDISFQHSATVAGRDVDFNASLHQTYGGGFSERWVGDLQGVSNVDAESCARVQEVWADVPLSPAIAVRVGRYDLNTEFDAIETGALFLSSPQGMGTDIAQSGAAGPSTFPRTAFGVRTRFDFAPGVALRGAILDVESETTDGGSDMPFTGGPLLALEYQRAVAAVTLKLGAWGFTETRPAIETDSGSGHEYGAYVSAERRVNRQLAWYARYGAANATVARIGRYAGAGIVFTGELLPGRDDAVGLAIAHARNGEPYRRSQQAMGGASNAAETAYELTWRIPVGAHVALQPDVQYVDEPDTNPAIEDALVVMLRVEAVF